MFLKAAERLWISFSKGLVEEKAGVRGETERGAGMDAAAIGYLKNNPMASYSVVNLKNVYVIRMKDRKSVWERE